MTSTASLAGRAKDLFERMRGRRIAVIGDVMVDEWIWGTVTRISPEAPVPVVAVSDHSFTLGGAGNVAKNLRALEASVGIASVSGDDAFARYLTDLFAQAQIDAAGMIAVPERLTTRKTRIVAHNQQVVRADWECTTPLDAASRERLTAAVRHLAESADAVVLSDYAKGLFSRSIVEAALTCPIVLADPKPQNLDLFTGVTCVAPNVHEAEEATGIAVTGDESMGRAARALLERLSCRYVVITRGEHGMALFGRDGERLLIPSVARTVFDVSGAGDTVVAVLSLALAADAPIELAMELANYAAGAVVGKLGTASADPAEILALVDHERR
jgi:rfaE bifunctional protein kinase chain/domain